MNEHHPLPVSIYVLAAIGQPALPVMVNQVVV
jgi:hypothetical protein